MAVACDYGNEILRARPKEKKKRITAPITKCAEVGGGVGAL